MSLLIDRAQRHGGRTAVVDSQGSFTYNDLLTRRASGGRVARMAATIFSEERVAFLADAGISVGCGAVGHLARRRRCGALPLNSPQF